MTIICPWKFYARKALVVQPVNRLDRDLSRGFVVSLLLFAETPSRRFTQYRDLLLIFAGRICGIVLRGSQPRNSSRRGLRSRNTSRRRTQAQFLQRWRVQSPCRIQPMSRLILFHRGNCGIVPFPVRRSAERTIFCQRGLNFRNPVRRRCLLSRLPPRTLLPFFPQRL